ncbi:MAG TPA: DUF3043 domain-containing protein [Mycolicibacillus parakoreensis]|nr:DUF3043 domain-containing protein [Mycolicibacillus parakoreensis]
MSLLGRKKAAAGDGADQTPPAGPAAESTGAARGTAPKGRPTPKRDAARRRGPVAPAPMTAAEARKRRKQLRPKLSREERKQRRELLQERRAESRQRMMAGEEKYLLDRDKGPVRRYVRDVVDARRNLLGLFMPSAFVLLFLTLAMPLQVQRYVSLGLLVLLLAMAVDAVLLGRKVNRAVEVKFPQNADPRWRLSLYAAGRASQLRRMRAPKPQVNRGDSVE